MIVEDDIPDGVDGSQVGEQPPSTPQEQVKAAAKAEARREASQGIRNSDIPGVIAETAADTASRCFLESLFDSLTPSDGCCVSEASFGPDCFVATATIGPQHPDLDILRAFRDRVLRRTLPGRAFIFGYYRYGGYAARFISDKPRLKFVVREGLVRPMARLSRRFLRA